MTQESTAFQFRMKPEVHKALTAFSRISGASINSIINEAVKVFLAHAGREKEVERLMHKAQRDYRTALDKLADL